MTRRTGIAGAVIVLLLAAAPAGAGDGRVPLPSPARSIGERCVEDVAVMRRSHMEFLMHQRDETVKGGIRGRKYSLRDCIACHATPDPLAANSQTRTALPFCSECHSYAAVRIDCFECHTPVAEPGRRTSASTGSDGTTLVRAIRVHLGGKGGVP